MGKRQSIPLDMGGKYSAGDGGSTPRGYVRELSNILPRPGRFPSRPPFAYDSLMNINGLMNFDDSTNKVSRLVAVDTTAHVYTKSATAGVETWSAANGTTIGGTRVTDFANYRNNIYAMVDNGSGLPSAAFRYDGTTITTSPFNSAIAGRTVTVFNDRLLIAYPRVTVTALINNGVSYSATDLYDFTNHWTATNVTAKDVVTSGTTICRLYPTNTTTASIKAAQNNSGIIGLTAAVSSAVPTYYVCRQDLRCTDPTYNMPVTLETYLSNGWVAGSYAAGDMISDGTNIQRCVVAGASGVGAPAWATTVGATTVDNAITWINEGTNILGSLETTVPNGTTQPGFTTYSFVVTVPPVTSLSVWINYRLKFGNTATPTFQLAPLDVSLRDGLTDGDIRKANRGFQLTKGDFYYPFFNQESSISATVDMKSVVWSEIADPKRIRAANTYDPHEATGFPTAATTISSRYIMAKRNAFWVFQGTDDPDIPIRRESYDINVGCIGPLAHDKYEDEWFFIGENEVYRFKVGGKPTPMCGEGMREEIMNKAAAGWVESQSTYKRPLLAIDKTRLVVWVYTQKAVLYAYDLRTQMWSKHVCPNGAEVDAMTWNANTGNMYVAFSSATYGLTRMDYTATANDTIDSTANTYSVDKTIVFRPIELYDPPRYDCTLEKIRLMHAATASQTSQTCTAYYSYDQGTTYTKSQRVTVAPLSGGGEFVPLPFDALQTAPSITVKVTHSGKAGESAWSLSPRAYADINVRRGEYIQNLPTAGAATL